MELYHTLREDHVDDDTQHSSRVDSIFHNGFWIGSASNKSRGIYLSNHSRYSWTWGRTWTIICHVAVPENTDDKCASTQRQSIQRHFSEIYSPLIKCNSEFVVSDPSLIVPVTAIAIQKFHNTKYHPYLPYGQDKDKLKAFVGFTPNGTFGCTTCDAMEYRDRRTGKLLIQGKRCDCPQTPTVLNSDIVVVE